MFMRLEFQEEMNKFFTSILVSAAKINSQANERHVKEKAKPVPKRFSQLLTSKPQNTQIQQIIYKKHSCRCPTTILIKKTH